MHMKVIVGFSVLSAAALSAPPASWEAACVPSAACPLPVSALLPQPASMETVIAPTNNKDNNLFRFIVFLP